MTSIGVHANYGHAFAGCTSLLPPSLSKYNADPAAVLAHLKRKAFLETPEGAAELEIENAARVAELEIAARAAEDSLLAELDAEDAAKKAGKKKKKKKKASGKKGKGAQQAEPADWRSDFQRYEQSETMRGVEQRKRQRNLEEAARVMAAHEQKIAALGLPPRLDPPHAAPSAAPDALAAFQRERWPQLADLAAAAPPSQSQETAEEIALTALDPPPLLAAASDLSAFAAHRRASSALTEDTFISRRSSSALTEDTISRRSSEDAPAETMEDIEAQIAALGLPPNFHPTPPPAAAHPAAPDAFMEMLLATAAPPAPAQQSLTERVRSLHLEVCGAEMPSGMGMAAAVALVEEGVLGGAREGGFRERVGVLEKLLSG